MWYLQGIVDKLILFILGLFLMIGLENRTGTYCVVAFCIAICFASLGIYVQKKKGEIVLELVYALLILFFPILGFFCGNVVYDNGKIPQKWVPLLAVGAFLGTYRQLGIRSGIFWGLTLLLAVYLSIRSRKIVSLEEEMIRQRDSSTELNLMLKDKNKNLMEKQDYEIYLATLKERNRIAREIHDNVGHMLSRSILQIGALLTIEKEGMVHEQLESMKDTLNLAMNSIRESVHDLHDDSVDLQQAITDAVEEMKKKYTLSVDYDMSKQVPRNVKYCFIATVKEAMSNVVKHSNASKVDILLREHPGFFQLSIADNGTTGSEKDSLNLSNPLEIEAKEGGIGLQNMRERVGNLNGTIQLRYEKGFHIFISIPKNENMK